MDIGGWLQELGLGQYEPAFRENAVDSAILPECDRSGGCWRGPGQRRRAGRNWITRAVHRQIAGLFVVEDKGEHELKGVAEKAQLYRIVRAAAADGAAVRARRHHWSAAARNSTTSCAAGSVRVAARGSSC